MDHATTTLKDLSLHQTARILSVGGEGALRQHFLDMGIIPGTEITFTKAAPMGDPLEFTIHGYELTLRKDDAAKISVEILNEETKKSEPKKRISTEHPGLGEGGKYHIPNDKEPIPKGNKIVFALVGNQNSGKTTLFNQLTGANQHVGNFPGVTVDRKEGPLRNQANSVVVDLPGIYSLSPYSPEELVSRNFVLNEKPDGLINIVDATNIERNFYLTMQLIELNIPMVLALNMMDEVLKNGVSIDINELEHRLGIPVVPISAAKNEGIDELIDHALHVAAYREGPKRQDFCDEKTHGPVHRAMHGIMALIEDHARENEVPLQFAASKLIEGDPYMTEILHLDTNEEKLVESIALRMEEEQGMDRAAGIADMRFAFIMRVTKDSVIKKGETKEHERSRKADKILTGKFTAVPAFLLILGAVFYLTFGLIGPFLQNLLERGISYLEGQVDVWLSSFEVSPWILSFVHNAVFKGVGAVVAFLPIIVLLFFFLSLLEDSGYMARIAFIMDKPLRKLGLSGRSIVPLLIGFGCTVPAIMSTRTLPSERDRKMTLLLTPFMSCTAKLPIYSFFALLYFPRFAWLIIIGVYLLDMLIGILMAFLYRKTLFSGEAVPFVMELPNYRLPGFKNVGKLLLEKAKDFLVRAFTVVFIATVVVWFLQSFNFRLRFVTDSAESILASLTGFVAPLFAPMGLSYWQVPTALVSGFLAKESLVSTLSVLFGSAFPFTSRAALSLIVFSSLYAPCIAAINSVRREFGAKWGILLALWQTALAWVIAFLVYLIAGIFI